MLADQGDGQAVTGALDIGLHLPGEWLSALVGFIASALPAWRDDPARETVASETRLTAQLCSSLNSLTRHTPGWDFLQFKREEPDESNGSRSIDLAVAPSGQVIWIEGREYNEYRTMLPIECKRLPTPAGSNRDEREYLLSRFSSTGGVQRFKAGHHAAVHARAAMIGYIQERDVVHWRAQFDSWIDGIVADSVPGWSSQDKLELTEHDDGSRTAALRSKHSRTNGSQPIDIDHLWIEL